VTHTPLPPSTDRVAALALLQDFNAFPNLQPLVIENKIIETPPSTDWLVTATTAAAPPGATPEYRAVTAAVPFGPFGKSNVTTRSGYVKTDDGIITVFQAPMGLYGQNRWRVVEAGEGQGLELLEEATLTGPMVLMPFIMMTEKKSHAELGAKFARELEGRLGGDT
jgi:hypothetical protein